MTKTEDKSVQVNLSKASEGKSSKDEKWIRAVVSSSSVDTAYDVVDNPSLRIPLKGGGFIKAKDLKGTENIDVPFLVDHDFRIENVIGHASSAQLNSNGELEMKFVFGSSEKAQSAYNLLKEGHLDNAFSITFGDYNQKGDTFFDGHILEVSLVWRGANQDARLLEISKGLTVQKDTNIEVVEAEETVVESEDETETNNNTEAEDVAANTDETEAEETEINKEIKMSEISKDVTTEAVVAKAVAEQPKAKVAVSKSLIQKNFVEQLEAIYTKNEASLMALASKGAELEGVESKVLDGSHIYLPTVIADDIKKAYVEAGGVGSLVNRVDNSGADIFKQVVETTGAGFQPVALGGTKPEDAPVWSETLITPYEWALIVVWRDGQAARSPIAVYNQIVRYIADQYKKLEDKIILTYAGGTVGSETRVATGLLPILQTAARSSSVTNYSSQYLLPALADAYSAIKSDAQLTIVANRNTWGQVATSLDGEYNPIFKVVGKQVTAGALGTFNVVTSEVLPDDTIVVGAFNDYTLVTRGDLASLFSQEATVGSTNLFTQNASGLRASIDIAGAATPVTSFWLLTVAPYVS